MFRRQTVGDILTDESKWTRGILAKNAQGKWRGIQRAWPEAASWCIAGAAVQAHDSDHSPEFRESLKKMADVIERDFPARIANRISYQRSESMFTQNVCAVFNNHPSTTFADIRYVIETAGV